MAALSGVVRRLRALGSMPALVAELRAEVGQLKQVINEINLLVGQMNHVVTTLVPSIHHTVELLNHDVRSGAEEALPLFVGYTERLRLDADTAIGAAQVIERQLSDFEHTLASLRRDE